MSEEYLSVYIDTEVDESGNTFIVSRDAQGNVIERIEAIKPMEETNE